MKKLFLTIAILFLVACSSEEQAIQQNDDLINPCEVTVWGMTTSFSTNPPTKSILYGVTRETAVFIQVDDYNWSYYSERWNSEDPFTCWEGIQTPPED